MLNSTKTSILHILTSIFACFSSMDIRTAEQRKKHVFISHSGDDKQTIAIPLRNKLREADCLAFVDDVDIPRGVDAVQTMYDQMESAHVFVFVLTRKFLVSEWPIKEMLFALDRCKRCTTEGEHPPTVIPLFYSLSPRQMESDITSMYKQLLENWGSDPVPQEQEYHDAVKTLRRYMGVDNHYGADNQCHTNAKKRRDVLLDELCAHVLKA